MLCTLYFTASVRHSTGGGGAVNIDSFKYFVAVAESGSFYQASKRLYVSQQGLNRHIAALERELDTKLLERTRSGIELTREGKAFLEGSRRVLSAYNDMLGDIFQIKHGMTFGDTPMRLLISFYAAQTAAADPAYVRLLANSSYIELPFDELVRCARNGDGTDIVYLDVQGHTFDRFLEDTDLVFEPVAATRCGIVCRLDSRFATRESVAIEDVAHEPVALCSFREMRQYVDALLGGSTLSDVRLETANPRMLLEYVSEVPGVVSVFDSFGFYLAQRDSTLNTNGLTFVPLKHDRSWCFMGFLQQSGVKQSLRVKYVKSVLHQWLDMNLASYFTKFPTIKIWEQEVAKRTR